MDQTQAGKLRRMKGASDAATDSEDRRAFIRIAAVTVGSLGLWPHGQALSLLASTAAVAPKFKVRTLTSGPKHHFFGYYGIPPWNKSGRHLACLESDFQDHLPSENESAAIGLVNSRTGRFTKVAETRAWNLQQGAMLHWNPLAPETEILFNDRRDGEVVSVVLDVRTGKKRYLPRQIDGVSRNGRYALSLTSGRLARLRPVVGYVGAKDPNLSEPHPDTDGVFLMDLRTGETKLVVSIAETYRRLVKAHPELTDRHMFFNHTVFNTNDTRFFFLARSFTPQGRLESAMFTANLDGSDLREVVPYGNGVSHFEWRNPQEILATFRFGGDEIKHVLFTDGKQDYRSIGEGFLVGDGHCSFAPDGKWIVTDRNHAETLEKSLMIYNVETKQGIKLGTFPMWEKRYFNSDLRCDLHPRWSRTGAGICFDALETTNWTRQLHIAYLDFAE
ncbi:MAG: hypothetical protein H0T92_17075 [Pyrinomonadaceae bacterium]|nr:hypothetical protein [Pyrinomonadaceae bacterium]